MRSAHEDEKFLTRPTRRVLKKLVRSYTFTLLLLITRLRALADGVSRVSVSPSSAICACRPFRYRRMGTNNIATLPL